MPTIQEMSDKIKLAHSQVKEIELAAPGVDAAKFHKACQDCTQAVQELTRHVGILCGTNFDDNEPEEINALTRELNSIAQAAMRLIR